MPKKISTARFLLLGYNGYVAAAQQAFQKAQKLIVITLNDPTCYSHCLALYY